MCLREGSRARQEVRPLQGSHRKWVAPLEAQLLKLWELLLRLGWQVDDGVCPPTPRHNGLLGSRSERGSLWTKQRAVRSLFVSMNRSADD
jgi:hypothetical protein